MDFRKLNSITKYPSILTYHSMGDRGKLKESLSEDKSFEPDDDVNVYEKVDGENSRIILLNDDYEADYIIGSREELLFAKGDRIGNPYGNIAEFLTSIAEDLIGIFSHDREKALTVIYQESFGGKTKAAKNYTNDKTQGYRVFDVFSLDHYELHELMSLPLEKIASWRDNGGQPFYSKTQKQEFISQWGLLSAPMVDKTNGYNFPLLLDETFEYLKKFQETKVGINLNGKSEGIIVRTNDRKMIRKIRFEDYQRTLQ
jgi:hypothetical protein